MHPQRCARRIRRGVPLRNLFATRRSNRKLVRVTLAQNLTQVSRKTSDLRSSYNPRDVKPEVLSIGEKVHIIHRRHFEKEPHRHFVGVVNAFDNGVARLTGHVWTVDPVKFQFIKRPELRTRLVSTISGDVLINIIPANVDLEKVTYQQESKAVRVTDGTGWHLDLSEFAWM